MELFRLLGTIAINNDEANKAINETTETAEKSQSKLSNAFEKIGGAAVKVGKVVATGVGVAATAVGALTTLAVKNYADYEQLVGGVETLFKDSADKVLAYADKAYKTAGMSANAYMETVTSFSASLLQSLGGDTAKAAEKADQAIVDMSDNANKMGTAMESIQNAYQGFAKQNYTMLDNLKLGYGGTKEEMQRLLADAQAISGIEYDISSYADVVDAIHVIQTEMGITGTTAKEASSTISGSISSMKSAWQNFLTGLADGNQNMDKLVSNLFESVKTVGSNLIPVVQRTINSIWNVVKENAPKILAEIPTMVMSILPQSVKDIMDEAHDYLCDTVMFGLDAVWESVQNLASAFTPLIDAVKGFLEPLKDAETQQTINIEICNWLEEGLRRLADVINIVAGVLAPVIDTIVTIGVPAIQAMVGVFNTLRDVVSEAIDQYIIPLMQDFATMIQELLTENQDKIDKIGELFTVLGEWISNVIQNYIYPVFQWFVEFVRSHMDNIKEYFQHAFDIIGGIVDFFIALFQGNWQGMWDAVVSILTSAVELVKSWFTLMQEFLAEIMNSIWSKITEIWENIKLSISQKIENIVSGISEKFSEAKEKAVEIFENMKESVTTAFEGLWTGIKGIINNIIGGMETMVNGVIKGINKLLDGVEEVANAAGELLGFDPVTLQINTVSLPRLATGGIVTKPTIAEIGEDGAEAVVPLERNTQWIQRVSEEMQGQGVVADNSEMVGLMNIIIELLKTIIADNGTLPETLIDAISTMRFSINNREFARLVKAVN